MRVVSLFSGAGGLDLGLIQAGHNIIWANDFDRDSVATYSANIGSHIVQAPIEDIPSSDIPNSDMIVGGFPCQGFSQANVNRVENDPRNALYREFVRVLSDKQPFFFLAENVRGLLSLDNGEAYRGIVSGFERAGYRVNTKVLNAADFGVPQNRHRVIFLGVRRDLPLSVEFNHPEPTHSAVLNDGKKPHVTVGEALKAVPDPIDFPDAVPNQEYSKYKLVVRNFTGHRLTDPNKPSPTILARGNGGGGVNATPHPSGLRRMSVRESATVQTFPLDFKFMGRMGSAYRQVGNAVPVKLGYALGKAALGAEQTLEHEKFIRGVAIES